MRAQPEFSQGPSPRSVGQRVDECHGIVTVRAEGDVELLALLVGDVREDSQARCERRQPVAMPRRHSVIPLATSTVGLNPSLASVLAISGYAEVST